jgi:fructose-specific phosphotransferase system IIC component
MMIMTLQVVNSLAFAFMAYILSEILAQSLKDSKLLKPIAMTICSITIAHSCFLNGTWEYILAGFAGFFLHTCVSAYNKRTQAPAKNRKKNIKINP